MKQDVLGRMSAKSKEQQLLNILQEEFHQPPRVAQAMVQEVQACLEGSGQEVKPGQMRVILVGIKAGYRQTMAETSKKEVIWTVDAGREDDEVYGRYGVQGLRQQRVQRLLAEAIEQEAVASQEDLARVLNVSVRTIKRDCAALEAAGIYLPTRGNLKGIGRGQTHKALIVGRWLDGETYDQIAQATRHSVESVQRYVQAFIRVIHLQQQGVTVAEIALLLQIGQALIAEYLAIYEKHDTPFNRDRLAEQLQRFQQRGHEQKKRSA